MSGFYAAAPGGWDWPDELINRPGSASHTGTSDHTPRSASTEQTQEQPRPRQPRERHWRPRTCRICLETVLPTYQPPSENLPGIFQSRPSVVYESEDGGRLLRPCKCKGTAKYVHEGCLQSWRHADPGYAKRNYWQCPTCHFRYRLQRLGWSHMISSVGAQIVLTVTILLLTTFLLGFVADPIIDFCLEPSFLGLFYSSGRTVHYDVLVDEPSGWSEHFMKGFASLGLMSLLKTLVSSPIQFFFRSSGLGGRTRNNTGRDRLSGITWIMVVVGVATFLFAIWKGVRAWSRRFLEKAGERVMDVNQGDEDDEDEEDGSVPPAS